MWDSFRLLFEMRDCYPQGPKLFVGYDYLVDLERYCYWSIVATDFTRVYKEVSGRQWQPDLRCHHGHTLEI